MITSAFSRRRFLRLTGSLTLAGASLPLWAHDMAAMTSGEEHPALRLAQPYKIKLAINKSAVCLAPVAVAEQQKIFSKYNLDVEFVNFGNSTDVLLEAIATGKADAGVGMALRWLEGAGAGLRREAHRRNPRRLPEPADGEKLAVRRPGEPEGANHRRHRYGGAG